MKLTHVHISPVLQPPTMDPHRSLCCWLYSSHATRRVSKSISSLTPGPLAILYPAKLNTQRLQSAKWGLEGLRESIASCVDCLICLRKKGKLVSLPLYPPSCLLHGLTAYLPFPEKKKRGTAMRSISSTIKRQERDRVSPYHSSLHQPGSFHHSRTLGGPTKMIIFSGRYPGFLCIYIHIYSIIYIYISLLLLLLLLSLLLLFYYYYYYYFAL